MAILFANNCATQLAANISAVDVSLTVATGTGARFPTIDGANNPSGNYFVITLQNSAGVYELVRVNHHLAGSDTLGSVTYPLQRAYWDSTTNPAAAWTSTNCVVDLRPVAQVMASFSSGMYGVNNLSDVSSAASARSNLGISAVNTPFTPTGAIVATDTQNAVAGVDAALTTHKSATGAHSAPNITYGGSTNVPAGTVDSALTSLGNGKQPLSTLLTNLGAQTVAANNVQAYSAANTPTLLSTGTASGNIPLVGTASATTTVAGLVTKATPTENANGTGTGVVASADLPTAVTALAIAKVAPGASGNLLTSNGSAWTSAAPPSAGVPVDVGVGGVGMIALMNNNSGGSIASGATVSGASLLYALGTGGGALTYFGAPAGTWRNIGATVVSTGYSTFQRIA